MEKRSLFNKIFKNDNKISGTFLKMLSGFNATFTPVSDISYDNIKVRECIDTIATHTAKLLPKHVQNKNGLTTNIRGEINYLLSVQPNPMMTTFDFIYKTISLLLAENNVYIYIARDDDNFITGFYPLAYSNCTLLEDSKNDIYIQFKFVNGNTYTLPYEDVIHLRKFYHRHDFYGETNDILISPIEVDQTTSEGIKNAIKTSMSLKGIIKYSNAMVKEKDIKATRDQFVKDFVNNLENSNSGIAALDGKGDFTALDMKPITLDKDQLQYVNNNIYNYYRIAEKMIQSDFSPDEWNAFYESIIEPIAIQLGYAFTIKIFNKKAISDGNQIIFDVNRIKYASTDTKIKLLKETAVLGLYTVDEAREILDMPAIGGEEGKKRIQTLNVINANLADEYQGGKKNE